MINPEQVDKMQWESIKLGDFWRFVDHENKLLTVGWKDIDNLDLDIIRVDKETIALMAERYQDYF